MPEMKASSLSMVYDGTYQGFLCIVFEAFERRIIPQAVVPASRPSQLLLGEQVTIETHANRAERVRRGIIRQSSHRNESLFHVAFLSELPGVELLLLKYLVKLFDDSSGHYWQNMLDDKVFELVQIARKVKKEVHRFHGFVRFQETADGMFFSPIDPDHNILCLLARHFRSRFSGQPWIIYDTKRNYGIYYNLHCVQEVVLQNHRIDFNAGNVASEVKALDEDYYCQLWQDYYDAVNILERKNHRQMTNFMPRRYWKYLPEKNKAGKPK